MARAALLLAVIALVPGLPEGCAKARKASGAPPSNTAAPPPALPVTSATTPPIWTPPEAPPEPEPVPSASPELAKARALAQAGDHKKVRVLLEKKVRAGKGSRDEAALLAESCAALRDKACVDAVKAKHPDIDGPSRGD